jgi:hypothetical protein
MAEYGPNTPLDISAESLWRGQDKTNGFVMKGDRIPVLAESFAKLSIGNSNPLLDPYVVTWGNGLWRDLAQIDTQPGTVRAEKPAKGVLVGILAFEQGWQTGQPVQNYGLPPYSRGKLIRKGLVGYKIALAVGGNVDDYLAYLKGERSTAAKAAVTFYKNWVTAWKGGADGSRLGIFFENTSGFPIVNVVAAGTPTLAGATFAGYGEVLEVENDAVFFDINL